MNEHKIPFHGPYAEAVWLEDEQRWRVRLNDAGRQQVEEFLKKYPDSTALIRHEFPTLAARAFRTPELVEECRQAIYETIVQGFTRFDPERGIEPQSYLSAGIVGAVRLVARKYADPENLKSAEDTNYLAECRDRNRLDPAEAMEIQVDVLAIKEMVEPWEWDVLRQFFGVDGGVGRDRYGYMDAGAECGFSAKKLNEVAKGIIRRLRHQHFSQQADDA